VGDPPADGGEEAVNRAVIEAPGFYERNYACLRSRWIFAGRGYVAYGRCLM